MGAFCLATLSSYSWMTASVSSWVSGETESERQTERQTERRTERQTERQRCQSFDPLKPEPRGGGARLHGLLRLAVASWVIRGGGNMPLPYEPELSMEPTLKGLAKYEQEFEVRDEINMVFNAKLQWAPSIPI